jgi:hypothetical protein
VHRHDIRLQAELQQQLRDKAEGTFLWVSLVCREVEGVPLYRTREMLQALLPGLDPLYKRMVIQIAPREVKTVGYYKDVLRSITLVSRSLQLEELAIAAGVPKDQFTDVQAAVDLASRRSSFPTVREGVVSFIHLSAKGYFTLGNGRQVFDVAIVEKHGRLANHLLYAMDSTLQRDMCSLQNPGARIQKVIATGLIEESRLL